MQIARRDRSRTEARLESLQSIVAMLFALTGWGACLSIHLWIRGSDPVDQVQGKMFTMILGTTFFLMALCEIWKTAPVHLHVVWHRHGFQPIDEVGGDFEPSRDRERSRGWMRESGLLDPDLQRPPSDPDRD